MARREAAAAAARGAPLPAGVGLVLLAAGAWRPDGPGANAALFPQAARSAAFYASLVGVRLRRSRLSAGADGALRRLWSTRVLSFLISRDSELALECSSW